MNEKRFPHFWVMSRNLLLWQNTKQCQVRVLTIFIAKTLNWKLLKHVRYLLMSQTGKRKEKLSRTLKLAKFYSLCWNITYYIFVSWFFSKLYLCHIITDHLVANLNLTLLCVSPQQKIPRHSSNSWNRNNTYIYYMTQLICTIHVYAMRLCTNTHAHSKFMNCFLLLFIAHLILFCGCVHLLHIICMGML